MVVDVAETVVVYPDIKLFEVIFPLESRRARVLTVAEVATPEPVGVPFNTGVVSVLFVRVCVSDVPTIVPDGAALPESDNNVPVVLLNKAMSPEVLDPGPVTFPPPVGAVGAHELPFHVSTLLVLGEDEETALPCKPATLGDAAVLLRSPAN